eukprot:SAG31_NODE_637_length_13337_cov_23.061867_1_plen_186_part_00
MCTRPSGMCTWPGTPLARVCHPLPNTLPYVVCDSKGEAVDDSTLKLNKLHFQKSTRRILNRGIPSSASRRFVRYERLTPTLRNSWSGLHCVTTSRMTTGTTKWSRFWIVSTTSIAISHHVVEDPIFHRSVQFLILRAQNARGPCARSRDATPCQFATGMHACMLIVMPVVTDIFYNSERIEIIIK